MCHPRFIKVNRTFYHHVWGNIQNQGVYVCEIPSITGKGLSDYGFQHKNNRHVNLMIKAVKYIDITI